MGFLGTLGGAALGFILAPATGGASLLLWTAGGAVVGEVAESIRDDSIETKARMDGYDDGFKEAEVASAKKLAEVLEKDDALKKAVFALGICVANVDNVIAEEEKGAIQLMIGQLDSALVSEQLKNDYTRILNEKPNFSKVKSEYLIKVSDEHLKELDTFVQDIINADGIKTKEEKDFYENEWLPYMRDRGVHV